MKLKLPGSIGHCVRKQYLAHPGCDIFAVQIYGAAYRKQSSQINN